MIWSLSSSDGSNLETLTKYMNPMLDSLKIPKEYQPAATIGTLSILTFATMALAYRCCCGKSRILSDSALLVKYRKKLMTDCCNSVESSINSVKEKIEKKETSLLDFYINSAKEENKKLKEIIDEMN